ncbi:MAG: CHAT domain-containing protein [Cyanobacteria bacterium J06639_16]
MLIFDEHGNPLQIADVLTPIPDTLTQAIKQWQNSFLSLVGVYRGIKPIGISYSNCADCTQSVRQEFVNWLTSQESWQRVQTCIDQHISSREEVQINIQTLDPRLRLLPWSEIFEGSHHYAETSISLAREFQRRGTLQPKRQVRILAILGSSSDVHAQALYDDLISLIDVDFDYQQLEQTQGRGAYIQTLNQPTVQELRTALREPEGWHIFFFAGHSKSLHDNSIGSFVLNQHEKPLSIDDLKADLAIAISNGLQIAIFNSCDGLGLANQLAGLNLPQSIVMREPVPDEVAKDFLQQFLSEFSHNRSLFESVRRSRQYLRHKYDHQSQYPGASWLPTIVRNPAVSLPKWNDFIAESPLPLKVLIPLSVIVIGLLCSLLASLYWEFRDLRVGSQLKYIYYTQLYPHIILYPCLFLWGAYFTLYKAWCQIRSRPKLWRQGSVALGIALILLCVELTQDDMMMFELKEGAVSTVSMEQTLRDRVDNIPTNVLDTSRLIDSENSKIVIRKADMEAALENFREVQAALSETEKDGYHALMKIGLAYSTWQGKQAFSVSRIFYGLAFMNIVAVIIASGIFWREIGSEFVYNGAKFVRYVTATQLIVLLWLPIRVYHNAVTKELIFGPSENAIFGSNFPLSGLDTIAYPVILSLLSVTIYKSWKFEASYISGVLTLLIILIFLTIGLFNPSLINTVFGLQSNPTSWILWPILLLTIIYLIYADIFAKK